MSEDEMKKDENIEHEVLDRLKSLHPFDFDYKLVDNSYVDAMLKARNIILDLYKQEKEKNSKLQKRNDKQFRLLRKKDKEIQEIKDISEHDWEERCRLTFKLEDYISKDRIKEKIEYLDNQQRQWLEDREIKNSDEEICFARDFLTKLLKEEE